jgi:glycosyltransferase involved in cell wall biosynthesis
MTLSPRSIPCSVLVLTRNSAATLDRCLRNLAPFGEILVHDANSEDDTVAIAERYGARVLRQYDTEERSVRVKNFTEIRLKQRADAAFDWVLYLDSDEFLSDELVEEVGVILQTAHPKTVVKFPRLPVIDGRVRKRGILFPEIVPRIHHRGSGCTLRPGKVVHEQYMYDSFFTVIVACHHLNVPFDPLPVLFRKDDRYLTLEVERIRRVGYPWHKYVRWTLLREPLVIASLLLRMFVIGPHYLRGDTVPFPYDWRYIRYHWRLFRAITGAMLLHPLRNGRVQAEAGGGS